MESVLTIELRKKTPITRKKVKGKCEVALSSDSSAATQRLRHSETARFPKACRRETRRIASIESQPPENFMYSRKRAEHLRFWSLVSLEMRLKEVVWRR